MSQRIGWDAGPGEAEAEAVDRRLTKARIEGIPGSIDRTAIAAVLQSEYESDRRAVPVRLMGGARINVLPLHTGAMFSVRLTDLRAVKLLDADPRRAAVVLGAVGAVGGEAFIGRSQAEADDASAYRITANSAAPYRFRFVEELWLRVLNPPQRISVMTEYWTR